MEEKEKIYKGKIKDSLNHILENGFIPEFGIHRQGKVRDIHFTSDKMGSPIIMVSSDRVSAFDIVLPRCIPFKGEILNLISQWAFKKTEDIVPNALIESPDSNMVIQKMLNRIDFECVVRGFVWGSLAAEYESGKRDICGIRFPDDILRYQKLPEPIFTPATKMDSGHDENVSFEYMAEKIGKELAEKIKDISVKLYMRGMELALEKGLVFIDTKYEFGLDDKGNIILIDEANTPDSSRFCTVDEYRKSEQIAKEMATGKYRDVTDLISKQPELKIHELSKQFVRDVLIEAGHSDDNPMTSMTDDQIVETSFRYISLYEKLTGETFTFPETKINPKLRLAGNIAASGIGKGCCAVIMAGSDSDTPHIKKIADALEKYKIPNTVRICSAHKQPEECQKMMEYYNSSVEPVLIIAVAGGTDALSGIASFHSANPVISCPPNKEEYESCLKNPPGSSNALILRPDNTARFAAQYFGFINKDIKKSFDKSKQSKIGSLKEADEKAQSKKLF